MSYVAENSLDEPLGSHISEKLQDYIQTLQLFDLGAHCLSQRSKIHRFYRDKLHKGEISSFSLAHRIIDREGNRVWVKIKGSLRKSEENQHKLLVGHIAEMTLEHMVDILTGLCSTEK